MEPEIDVAAFFSISPVTETAIDAKIDVDPVSTPLEVTEIETEPETDAAALFLTNPAAATAIEAETDVAATFLTSPAVETATDAEILVAPETVAILPAKGRDENGVDEKLIYSPPLVKMLSIA